MNTQAVTYELSVIETASKSNEELLRLMARKNEDPEAASAALAAFYERHKDFLGKRLHKVASKWLDDDAQQDFVHEAFLRAYEKAHTFKGQGFKDEVQERRYARAWLGTIASNLLCDWLRTRKEIRFESLDDEKVKAKADGQLWLGKFARFQQSSESKLLHEAFGNLSEREQAILSAYGLHVELGENGMNAFANNSTKLKPGRQFTIPDKELDELASNLNMTKDNIRQTKHRAIKKIQEFIQLRKGT